MQSLYIMCNIWKKEAILKIVLTTFDVVMSNVIITLQTEICMVFVVTLPMFNATIGDFNGCAISNKSIEVKQTYHNCYYVL